MAEPLREPVVVVFAGGDPPPVDVNRWMPPGAWVIAADSGLDHAHRLGWPADLLVGDLDSVSDRAVTRHRGQIERHPPDKDHTDLELAMQIAAREGETVMVMGGHGGRLDHWLSNAALLADRRWSTKRVIWLAGCDLGTVVHHKASLYGTPGDVVSLITPSGPAKGITTEGLRWPIQDGVLSPGSTRGVSNRFLGKVAQIEVAHGVILAVQPDAVLKAEPRPAAGR